MSKAPLNDDKPGTTDVLWFLPTHGDGRYLGSEIGARHVSLNYLSQIARAADELGYFGVLIPTGRSCEDSWIVASAMVPLTQRLRYLVAVRPGLSEPSMTARMAATLDRLSNGRLLVNVVAGGDPNELKGDGVFLDHDLRYAVTRRIPRDLEGAAVRRRDHDQGQASQCGEGQAALSPGAAAASRRSISAVLPAPARRSRPTMSMST